MYNNYCKHSSTLHYNHCMVSVQSSYLFRRIVLAQDRLTLSAFCQYWTASWTRVYKIHNSHIIWSIKIHKDSMNAKHKLPVHPNAWTFQKITIQSNCLPHIWFQHLWIKSWRYPVHEILLNITRMYKIIFNIYVAQCRILTGTCSSGLLA